MVLMNLSIYHRKYPPAIKASLELTESQAPVNLFTFTNTDPAQDTGKIGGPEPNFLRGNPFNYEPDNLL